MKLIFEEPEAQSWVEFDRLGGLNRSRISILLLQRVGFSIDTLLIGSYCSFV